MTPFEITITILAVAVILVVVVGFLFVIEQLRLILRANKELLDFETRHEQRNDEMFARCEEINKLQLKELQQRVHTYDTETYSVFDQFPPVDVVGVTATGICQDCNGKTICKHYNVNRDRCFVADGETTNNEQL